MSATLRKKFWLLAILGLIFLAIFAPRMAAQGKPGATSGASTKAVSAEVASDPVLKAMREELDRSKSQLKMDGVAAPYYIDYRIADVEEWTAESAFGSLRQDQLTHVRSARVVVRVGDGWGHK